MIANRLSCLRQMADISQRGLSSLAGLHPNHVFQIESGNKETITAFTAEALSVVLGCSLDWLIAGRGKAPSARTVRAHVEAARSKKAA